MNCPTAFPPLDVATSIFSLLLTSIPLFHELLVLLIEPIEFKLVLLHYEALIPHIMTQMVPANRIGHPPHPIELHNIVASFAIELAFDQLLFYAFDLFENLSDFGFQLHEILLFNRYLFGSARGHILLARPTHWIHGPLPLLVLRAHPFESPLNGPINRPVGTTTLSSPHSKEAHPTHLISHTLLKPLLHLHTPILLHKLIGRPPFLPPPLLIHHVSFTPLRLAITDTSRIFACSLVSVAVRDGVSDLGGIHDFPGKSQRIPGLHPASSIRPTVVQKRCLDSTYLTRVHNLLLDDVVHEGVPFLHSLRLAQRTQNILLI